ncbi:MAG: glycosyltransferase family A protein [Gemmatimonadaceae bacterium]
MSGADPAVTIIIPTCGRRDRACSIQAAIASALGQEGVRATVIVVLNGRTRDAEVERTLRGERRIVLLDREVASLAGALAAGRETVRTPWFSALDDDDLFLPGALRLRVDALQRQPECAAVVTNGYQRDTSGDVIHMMSGHQVHADPVRAMLVRNWLLPGSWLCRADRVGVEVFSEMPDYLECTYLALRLATEHRIVWLDTPTVVYCVGSPGAASRSRAFVTGQVRGLRRILELNLPGDVRRVLRARVAAAYHTAADRDRIAGNMRDAWRWHARSLLQPSGWRYAPFTRHLLRDSLRHHT